LAPLASLFVPVFFLWSWASSKVWLVAPHRMPLLPVNPPPLRPPPLPPPHRRLRCPFESLSAAAAAPATTGVPCGPKVKFRVGCYPWCHFFFCFLVLAPRLLGLGGWAKTWRLVNCSLSYCSLSCTEFCLVKSNSIYSRNSSKVPASRKPKGQDPDHQDCSCLAPLIIA